MDALNSNKSKVPRVDLTAMVDLGFLLITFFMLATTMTKPKAMEVNKPNPDGETDVRKSKTLCILLGEKGKVYWYVAADDAKAVEIDSTDLSQNGIRKVIQRRQREVDAQWGSRDELIVLIKSMNTAKYQTMISVLDEMVITDTKRYAIVETDKVDTLIMQRVGQGLVNN